MKTLKIIRDIAAILAELSLVVLVVYCIMQGQREAWTVTIIFAAFFGICIPFNWKDYRNKETRSELVRPLSPQSLYGQAILFGFMAVVFAVLMCFGFDSITWPFFLLFTFLGLFFCLSNVILYKFRKQIED